MSLDHELFVRDAIEKAIKESPEYDNLKIKLQIDIDGDRIIVKEGVDSSELLR